MKEGDSLMCINCVKVFSFWVSSMKNVIYDNVLFFILGVCNIPPCTSRTPLEGHLCRITLDDECFAFPIAGTTNWTCVTECPQGTEEGREVDAGMKMEIIVFFFYYFVYCLFCFHY
jgi:hypothetical protein